MTTAPRVVIVGAGPGGLVLGCLLAAEGFRPRIIEHRSREHIQTRPRAGVFEHRTVTALSRAGLTGRMATDGREHDRCEIRVDGQSHVLRFRELCGATQWAWPQQELVTDLIAEFLRRGGRITFNARDVAVHDIDSTAPSVSWRDTGSRVQRADAQLIVGADGFHGVCRPALADQAAVYHRRRFDWLCLLAAAAPSAGHMIYGVHRDGLALHAPGSTAVTRFSLQVDRSVARWSADRVWNELECRLGCSDRSWDLRRGDLSHVSVLSMSSYMASTMTRGRLFVLGDTAHVVTPVGAKGANLAVADAAALAQAITQWSRGEEAALRCYSAQQLRDAWTAQEFSHALTDLLHRPPGPPGAITFAARLQRNRLMALLDSPARLTEFAHRYVGVAATEHGD